MDSTEKVLIAAMVREVTAVKVARLAAMWSRLLELGRSAAIPPGRFWAGWAIAFPLV